LVHVTELARKRSWKNCLISFLIFELLMRFNNGEKSIAKGFIFVDVTLIAFFNL